MVIRKINGFLYEAIYDGKVLYTGRNADMLAHCHWNYGISKDEIRKALNLLDGTALKIIFNKDMKIALTEYTNM